MDFSAIFSLPDKVLIEGFQTRAPVPKQDPRWTVEQIPQGSNLPDLKANKYGIYPYTYNYFQNNLRDDDGVFVIKDKEGTIAGVIIEDAKREHLRFILGNEVKIDIANEGIKSKTKVLDAKGAHERIYDAGQLKTITVSGPPKGNAANINVAQKMDDEKIKMALNQGNLALVVGEKTRALDTVIADLATSENYKGAHPTDIQIYAPVHVLKAFQVDSVTPVIEIKDKPGNIRADSGQVSLIYNSNTFEFSSVRPSEDLPYLNDKYNASLHASVGNGSTKISLFNIGKVVPADSGQSQKTFDNLNNSDVFRKKKGPER